MDFPWNNPASLGYPHFCFFPPNGCMTIPTKLGNSSRFWKECTCENKKWPHHQWPFQEPKMEVPTIYKAYVRPMYGNIPRKYGLIWYSTSILGAWNSHWHHGFLPRRMNLTTSRKPWAAEWISRVNWTDLGLSENWLSMAIPFHPSAIHLPWNVLKMCFPTWNC